MIFRVLMRLLMLSHSVMSNSVQPHRWQPTRLPRPWDSPDKNTGVGFHFLLQCMKLKSESEISQSCPTLRDPPGLQPTRLLRPWDFQGKSTGVGCHCPLCKTVQLPVKKICNISFSTRSVTDEKSILFLLLLMKGMNYTFEIFIAKLLITDFLYCT